MKALAFLMLCLALLSISHADAAPGPLQPSVTVYLVRNGAPAADVTQVTYHCYGENATSAAPSEQRLAVLNCTGGTCTNSGQWFNKLNPCFFFPGGFFSYESDGKQMDSGTFSTERKDMHYITIDVDSGEITKQTSSNICFFSMILPALAAIALVYRII